MLLRTTALSVGSMNLSSRDATMNKIQRSNDTTYQIFIIKALISMIKICVAACVVFTEQCEINLTNVLDVLTTSLRIYT